MKILALDTAASLCAVAIYDAEAGLVLAEVSQDIGKGHAEVLMSYVEEALTKAQLPMTSIDRIAVNVGPGSFTGVRIAVSAARGFALALEAPAIGITGFEALAAEARADFPARPVLVLLDAHRGEVYTQAFDSEGKPEGDPQAESRDEALARVSGASLDTVLTGSAATSITETLDHPRDVAGSNATGHIATFAKLAATRNGDGAPKPLYLRGADAKPQTGFALARQTASVDNQS